MASSPTLSLSGVPEPLLDALVSNILNVCPTLTSVFLHGMGSQIHTSTVKAVFSTLQIPDDVRYFWKDSQASLLPNHPLSAILHNPARYAHIVKKIVVNEAELPSISQKDAGAVGLITICEDDEESDKGMVTNHSGRIAVQPMRAEDLTSLLTLCADLESFIWRSANPPPDGICEVLSEQCPKLSSFVFRPDPPLRAVSVDKTCGLSPLNRSHIVKWDAASLRLLSSLPLTQLYITRLSLPGSQALISLFEQLGEESLLEDVNLNLIWFEDVCEQLVKAGRRIKKLHLGTSGTKLTDKDIITVLEGCESLEEFALVEAEARLSRKLWSKVNSTPPRLRKFTIAISESSPHHSWIADHLESFACLKLDTITHLSIKRILPFPQLTASEIELEYDSKIDSVALMKPIQSDVVDAIRGMSSLVSLQCDWWSWKLDDVKALTEKCTKLEYLELALDAPFTKLLAMTSTFALMTQLRRLAVSIPTAHSPGSHPGLLSPFKAPVHPLTPAASPARRKTSLPSLVSDFASQVFVGEDYRANEQVDVSFPPLREIKKFVKKCPKLLELEWYGRNARGRWLISRTSNCSSKTSPNVSVEYMPPVASVITWNRATLEKAALDFITSGGGTLSHDIPRQGQEWTGSKAEDFKKRLEKEKDISSCIARDKSTKVSGKRDRVSISSSASGGSGILVESQSKNSIDNSTIAVPISPISPLQPGSTKAKIIESPVEDPVSPTQFTSLSIPTESPIRNEDNERHRFRRATFSESGGFPPTPRRTAPFTASRIKARSESKNTNSANVNNSSSNKVPYETHIHTSRGGSNNVPQNASRRAGFGRGGDNKRGIANDRLNAARGLGLNGFRRGNTIPM